jgi:murein tripeptide amidase MpaA
MIRISSDFDGGNIICDTCDDPSDIRLRIRPDNNTDILQWFYFRLANALDISCELKLTNAGAASYPRGWEDYRAVASYDRENWFRIDTEYVNDQLVLRLKPEHQSVYIAFFAPYSMERHADLIARMQMSEQVQASIIGSTLDGQDMDLLTIGKPDENKKKLWFIARQHPGETMAEWWMEGFLDRLLDPEDAASKRLLKHAVFYVVPNMNPDGSRRGHLRTNAGGANLNREWSDPDPKTCPEVYHVQKHMQQTGVDFCLDVHGDEALPYNFLIGTQGIKSWDTRRDMLLTDFKRLWQKTNSDFQTTHGYPIPEKGKANMALCGNNNAEFFGCVAMTLEMPFKDTADTPNANTGWSPERSRKLGASILDVLQELQDRI